MTEGIGSIADSATVIVSHHVHPGRGSEEEEADEAQEEVAKAAIDAGAAIVVGHGPHTLRAVEFYRRGVILYGLGSLFLEVASTRPIPWEALEDIEGPPGPGSSMNAPSRGRKPPYLARPSSRWGLVAKAELANGRVRRVVARPVLLRDGRPRIVPTSEAASLIEHMRRICKPRGTRVRVVRSQLVFAAIEAQT